MKTNLKIQLVDVNREMTDAYQEICGDLDDVSIINGSIFDGNPDAVVSPANSFGFMDGGIDAFYKKTFGSFFVDRIQDRIKHLPQKEVLVGSCEIFETQSPSAKYLFLAPTMRVPMNISNTVNPYLACRAVLLKYYNDSIFSMGLTTYIHDVVNTIAIPGLGTGCGNVSPEQCARQVREAILEVTYDDVEYDFPESLSDATLEHMSLIQGNVTTKKD